VTGLQAAHPIILESSVILAGLRGLSLQGDPVSGAASANQPGVTPVFSLDDAQFLAPLISTALSTATANQFVIFRVFTAPVGAGPRTGVESAGMISLPREETAGALYVRGRSLHITLTKCRDRLNSPGVPDHGKADSTGLTNRTLLFTPASAMRPELSRRDALPLSADLPSVVVDYQAFPRIVESPVPSSFTTYGEQPPVSPATEEVRELKDLVVKKDLELERMRDEINRLKQELKDLAAQRGTAGTHKPPPRTAPSTSKP
jgi:uncharacterized coiled-coil protein SlyX